jgi:5'-3' exonuclease
MSVLLVDGNNIGMRAWSVFNYSGQMLTTSTGEKTTVLVAILKSIDFAIDNANLGQIEHCIICWDKGKKYRKDLFPQYKGNRTKNDNYEDMIENFDTAQKYLTKLGVAQAFLDGMEADDIIGLYARTFVKRLNKSVYIFSDDSDFGQLLCRKVKQYRPSSQKVMTACEFVEQFNIEPKYFNKMIAITGQGKDNIPGCLDMVDGVPKKIGLGEVKAVKMMKREDGSIRTLKEVVADCTDLKFKDNLVRNYEQMLLSYKLSKIRTRKKEYDKEEYKYLMGVLNKCLCTETVRQSSVQNIMEFLEIHKTNLLKILKKIGVNVK